MRLGRIPWINCYPIYRAIDRGVVPAPCEMITATAAELNDLLAAGELDVSVTGNCLESDDPKLSSWGALAAKTERSWNRGPRIDVRAIWGGLTASPHWVFL